MFLHDAARNPQSEAGPGVFLGGVARFEDLAQMVAGNPAAGVGHGDADSHLAAGPVAARRYTHLQRTSVRHGIHRIHKKIGE